MRYVSVCSGIEAATVAWHPLGWVPLMFAEIAKFPSRVLAHHYPQVPNAGDFTSIRDVPGVDLLVGGTPCQSFSLAGLRGGLADDRGNLALGFMRLADRLRPRWLLWENVPGVLSSGGGRDFGSILGALAELGYGFAYRVLDAQFFGVPQRRRRVFVVGHLGDWRRAAAVLSERTSMSRDTPKGGETQGRAAARARAGATGDRRKAVSVGGEISHTLRGVGFDASEDGTGRGTPVVAFSENSRAELRTSPVAPALSVGGGKPGQGYSAIMEWPKRVAPTLGACFGDKQGLEDQHIRGGAGLFVPDIARSVTTNGMRFCATQDNFVSTPTQVRRLTPVECERLQGFPDRYTGIPGGADGPRYMALGNSMAVPVMRWIGQRIASVDCL